MAEIRYGRIASRTRVAVGAHIEPGNLPGDDPCAGPARRDGHAQLRVGSRRLLLRIEELELRKPGTATAQRRETEKKHDDPENHQPELMRHAAGDPQPYASRRCEGASAKPEARDSWIRAIAL
jgi:hypothetical protein